LGAFGFTAELYEKLLGDLKSFQKLHAKLLRVFKKL
jgi:hypothetical protein